MVGVGAFVTASGRRACREVPAGDAGVSEVVGFERPGGPGE